MLLPGMILYSVLSFLPRHDFSEQNLLVHITRFRLCHYLRTKLSLNERELTLFKSKADILHRSTKVFLETENYMIDLEYISRPKLFSFHVYSFVIIFE